VPRRKPLPELLVEDGIRLDCSATDREDAIRQTGELLVGIGAVDPAYVTAMLERERAVSTYVGEAIAFPHATLAEVDAVNRDAIVVLRFPDGVDWDGKPVSVVIGLAAQGRGHIGLLSRLATVLLEPGKAQAIRAAERPADVYAALGTVP
jgi:PTS system mannitol-specific IIA component